MKILSHRGYWKTIAEKNSERAFMRSFSLGFGTETDVRDYQNRLVISHDIATGMETELNAFLTMANSAMNVEPLTIALNIKADGLATLLARTLEGYHALDCFVFDMSVPDMPSYFDAGVRVFTRMSEVERQPAWLDLSAGVWLDGFDSEWFDCSVIRDILGRGKRVCIVSPELHRRSHLPFWDSIHTLAGSTDLMLCTDFPEEATAHFAKALKIT